MKKITRMLILMLTLTVLLGALAVSASAETVASGKCGDNLTWTLSDRGVLTISGTGDMWDYDAGMTPWYSNRLEILKIVVRSGVRSIGNYAFSDLEALQCASLPSGLKTIGDNAFDWCLALESVNIPESVTKIGRDAFVNCRSLAGIEIPEGVLRIENCTFYQCFALKCIALPDSLTSIGDTAFWDCGLESITIPKNVSFIGYGAFVKCGKMQSFSVARDNAAYCARNGVLLTKDQKTLIYWPGAKPDVQIPASVTGIGDYAFGYSRITNITIPENVTRIGYASFSNCGVLKEVHLPDSLEFLDAFAFGWCESLEEIRIPKGVAVFADNVFDGCTNLRKIRVSADNPVFCCVDDVLISKDGETLVRWPVWKKNVEIPYGVKNIVGGALRGSMQMTDLVLPKTVERIGSYTFSECYNLKSITIPQSLQTVDIAAFADCPQLETVYYTGSQAQWQKLMIVCGNEDLLKTHVVFDYVIAPKIPTVVGTHDAATGKNMLVWEPVEGAAAYKVYRATAKDGPYTLMKTVRDGESYINATAEPGVTYYYRVRSVDVEGAASKYSAVKTLICDLAQPVVKATNVASTGYNKLTWDAIPGATAYKVYRSTSKTGTFTLMKTVKDGATSYVNSNAVAGTTYYYYVVAVMDGKDAATSAKSEIKISTCDLPQPTITLTSGTGKITVKWDKVEKATGYKIYRATSKDGTYTLVKTITSGDTVSWSNTGLTAGKTYYYKMVAILDGKDAATSAYSSVKYTTAK